MLKSIISSPKQAARIYYSKWFRHNNAYQAGFYKQQINLLYNKLIYSPIFMGM